MQRTMFKSKIHRAVITDADLEYEGSITLDPELMELAQMSEFELVHIWNVTRGTRLQTYTLCGERGSRVCCINGAAAHLMKKGDRVIIATFASYDEAELENFKPTVVLVDENNNVKDANATEVPGPMLRTA